MHNSYNIPLPGRKLLPLTQTTPHPCTRVKNCSVTKKKRTKLLLTDRQTDRVPTPAFLSLQQPLLGARNAFAPAGDSSCLETPSSF